ncbi:MAG: replication-associated recombination protein A [Bdellovibrionota bacterium]
MDLFAHAQKDSPEGQPLAERLRPRQLEDMLGQTQILGANAPWRKLLESGRIPSLILWGPPGSGKTTFALLLAQKVDAEFITINAVETGAKALRELGDEGRRRRLERQRKTLLFIDEIHRLNKGQQDVLLPFIEKGDLVLVGATTENPSYEINSALLSRCRILVFQRLGEPELKEMASRAAATRSTTLPEIFQPEAEARLMEFSDGDGRRLLNLMELILNLKETPAGEIVWPLSSETLANVLDAPALRYDKSADEHYDTISAFIKSVRGSDPDAAMYYLARMIKGGEDPVFIARRLVILASEDIGNADPRAITLAVSGLQAVELVGFPEAAISLAQVTTYLASAPKSNRSYVALQVAQELVEKTGTVPVPLALRSAKTRSMKELGYGKGYKYSHEGEKGYLPQRFLPDELGDVKIYEPTDHGFEKNIRQYLEWLKT